MQSSSSTITAPPKSAVRTDGSRVDARALLALATLGLLWFILCRHLSGEWSVNEQYSYGWFVPFFAAYLFWLRWDDRPQGDRLSVVGYRLSGGNAGTAPPINRQRITNNVSPVLLPPLAFLLLAALLPLRLFEVGNPDWRPLGWVHAAIVVGITLAVIWRYGGMPWLKHFAFPVCFILVAVPWVTPIEAPIVQGLMSTVAAVATETLALCGIPAELQGSVIRINTGVVGVNEACSGVRSLQTSLMIGLLFGELKRFSVFRRIALVLAAASIAFLANCGRAFFLVWIAARDGVAAVDQWHDIAGYVILGAVFLGTVGAAAWLSPKGESRKEKLESGGTSPNGASDETTHGDPNRALTSDFRPLAVSPFRLPTSYFLLFLTWLLAVEAGVELWYRSHERNLVATPSWRVRWPEGAPAFAEIPINEDVAATLRYDDGRQARWRVALGGDESAPTTSAASCSMFFFRWEPGTSSILRARAHRPDVCLPNTGWELAHDFGVQTYRVDNATELPFRHFSFRRPASEKREVTAHAFFCQREDRIPAAQGGQFNLTAGAVGEWSRSDRMRVVLQGLRNQGQQVLQVVIMTPGAIDVTAVEAEFRKLVPEIVAVGGEVKD